jgi:hypothetical protein
MTEFMLIAFDSTHKAIHFERLLLNHFAIELIPTPREITASCGLSLKYECDDHNQIMKQLIDESKTGVRLFHYIKLPEGSRAVQVDWRDSDAFKA